MPWWWFLQGGSGGGCLDSVHWWINCDVGGVRERYSMMQEATISNQDPFTMCLDVVSPVRTNFRDSIIDVQQFCFASSEWSLGTNGDIWQRVSISIAKLCGSL